jgi:hypothetical protein
MARPQGRARTARRRQGPARSRRRGGLLIACAATVGLSALGIAGAARRQPAPTEAERQVQREIDAMVASGVPDDDPKVELLEDQLTDLRNGSRANPPKEPGVDLEELVDDAKTAETADAQGDAAAAATGRVAPQAHAGPASSATTDWQSGPVECEPVPQMLSAAEIAGASCTSVPQPDGSSRYVAVAGDGTVRTVAFGNDGQVRRTPDRKLPVRVTPGATALAPTATGDLQVSVRGRAPVTVDVG